ncbi:TPA: hypothetical protein ACH3X3_004928 [Trebouxia sp. C0006]
MQVCISRLMMPAVLGVFNHGACRSSVANTKSFRTWFPYVIALTVMTTWFCWEKSACAHTPSINLCIFGSAETRESAVNAATQFPNTPHWFVIWGEDVEATRVSNVQMLAGLNTTHASAWALALEAIRKSKRHCDFFFATDDDLQWTATDVGVNVHKTNVVEKCVLQFLADWYPAVTTFMWPWGDEVFASLRDLTALHEKALVQPATGFDNGALIFHRSVVDFFVPVWLGSDFTPAYTIQHTFQNFFIPFLFQSHAIRYNGVRYVNPPKVRHAYDSERTHEFKAHITRQMKCYHRMWGPLLSPEIVYWQAVKNCFKTDYDIDLSQIALFYNVTDSVISQHPYFRHEAASVVSSVEQAVNKALANNLNLEHKACVTSLESTNGRLPGQSS